MRLQESLLVVFLLSIVLLLAAGELGYRVGLWKRARADEVLRSQISTTQAAVFGLLALLLAFTFSMAVQRFDVRKQLVLDEANAIGSAYLRADFLDARVRDEMRSLLRTYVDLRLEYGSEPEGERREQAFAEARALQGKMWTVAVAAVRQPDSPRIAQLFVESLNELVDVDAKRMAAYANTVPLTVWFLLGCIAVLAVFTNGYGAGSGGHRLVLSMLMLPLVTAAVIAVCVDLDRPRRGLILVSQQSMAQLRESLQEGVIPTTTP